MIPDHLYARRLGTACLAALSMLAAGIWFWPEWRPPAPRPQPASPQVFFLPYGAHTSAEYAAIWSPAAIALPGTPAQLAPENGEHLVVPPLETSALLPLPDADGDSGAGRDSGAGILNANGQRHWTLFRDYLGSNIFRIHTIDPPDTAQLAAPAADGGLPFEISLTKSDPALELDYSQVDADALPRPAAPCSAVLLLDFDETGRAARVLIETPTGKADLDAELARQARRITARGAESGRPPRGPCRLHLLFPGI